MTTEILELKYEELFSDPTHGFQKLFEHYGFTKEAVQHCLEIANQNHFESVAKRSPGIVHEKSVTRSGKPGQWQEYFTDRIKEFFEQEQGELLIQLNYEQDCNW